MEQICGLASREEIGALYVQGRLIIVARGTKPTPCHTVEVRQSELFIFPRQYELLQCVPRDRVCPPVTASYRAVGTFHLLPPERVAVRHRDGTDDVPVVVIDDPIGAPASEAGMVSLHSSEGPAAGAQDAATAPLRFGLLLEKGDASELRSLSATRVESTGYSARFSFDEAFQDAVANLPPDPRPYPDKLTSVTVERIGAEFGGFAGLHRMLVRVKAWY